MKIMAKIDICIYEKNVKVEKVKGRKDRAHKREDFNVARSEILRILSRAKE